MFAHRYFIDFGAPKKELHSVVLFRELIGIY